MKKHSFMSIISLLLVICLSLSIVPITAFAEENNSTSGLEDLIAGISSVEDIYGELDRETVPEIIGYDYAVSKAHVQRLYEAEDDDLNRVVFLNADGTQTAYIFDFPVKYIDERGAIKDITLDIADSNTLGQFETASGSSVTTFSRNATDGIRLVGNGTVLSLVPHIPVTRSGAELSSSSKITVSSTAKRIDNKTVSYDYDSKTTIEYSLTYTGFKEDIVVNEYTGQTEYDFTLYTNGLELTEIDGSFYLVDEENVVKATLGDIIIFTADEKNNTMGDLNAQTVVAGQEYLLTIVVDSEFLASEDTVYPIRIDPTVEICYDNNGAGAIADVTLNSNSGSSGTSGSLSVGLRETYGISRILMKFPGLNLSSLGSNITITNATVEIRDLMCEGTELDVSCYVFSGNTWDESTANWSNVSPNSISTFLSSNVISYANGTQQATAHRYSFDITQAVEGWRTGNYNPNKGIIFKGPSSVENGSAYNCKTIASYNRASYKPSLSVTYGPTSNLLSNDTYYLNNRYCGDYLRYTSSSATATSGLISSLGNSIRWEIRSVEGGYVIRSKTDTTKYLGVPTDTGSTSASIVTVSDSTIPTRCIWKITIANGGGCLVKNTYNSKYLYSYGNSVYTSTSTGSTGTSTYGTRVWRIASTTYYGSSSSYERRELQDGFSISNLIVDISQIKTPSINKNPSNAIWASSSDFTFSYYSGTNGIVSFNTINGSVTGQKSGIATYKATHKVTNRTYYFKIYVDRYTYELVHSFGFNDNLSVLIRELYNRVDTVFSNETSDVRAWKCARVLSEFCYDDTTYLGINKWNDVAGSVTDDENREQFFVDTLGYTSQEYSLLSNNLKDQHNKAEANGVIDFCHLQYSLAARLAYSLDYDSSLSNWGTGFFTGNVGYYTDEEISYFAGWLGDAVLTGESGNTTSFKNDDYTSDLDAENIYHIILEGSASAQAFSSYYTSLANGSNRSVIFKTHIAYETVRNKVFTELIDAQILYWMSYYSNEGNFVMVQYYSNLLNNEEYHWNTISTQYPDTYNFLRSLNDGLSNMANY